MTVMNHQVALDRDALYYPYVHITDVNWLKGTLLCFPGVRRMVPGYYEPNDLPEIKEFCNTAGPRGEPLLTNANLFCAAATAAETDLLEKLKANDQFIRSRYSRRKTIQELGDGANLFRLHDEKIIYQLTKYLKVGGKDDCLAWRTEKPEDRPLRHYRGEWLGMHPALANAILAIKAIAIAEDNGLDIVTDSESVHHTVISKKPDDIFDELIGKHTPNPAPTTADVVDDLAEIVLSTNFDVRKLSAKQIAELLADGKDLRQFKNALLPVAASLPEIRDPDERAKRLQTAAAEIGAEWEKYKKKLPWFALEALLDTSEVKWPELANTMLGGGAAWKIGGGVGLGLAVVSYAGLKVWHGYKKKTSSPYSYLSKISRAASEPQHPFLILPAIYRH